MQTAEQNPKTTTRKGKPAWVITDDSACKQKGRQLAPGVFEFKEKRGFMGKVKATIALADYDEERRNYYSEAYYGTLANLKAQNGPDWEWILAEIIFEQLPL